MDKKAQFTTSNVDGCSSNAFRVYKLDNTRIHTVEDVHKFRFGASRRGKVCVQLLDSRSRNARSDEEASRVAGIWLNAIKGMPMWSPMVRTPPPSGLCMRADAHAEGNSLGIGGWAGFPDEAWNRSTFRWFSLQFNVADFPPDWNIEAACLGDKGRIEGHRIIAGLETLAQTVLLVMARDFLANSCGPCFLPMESDNAPTVGAVNTIFSNKWPLAHFVLNFHHWSIQCSFQAEATHVKGVDNDYADELSRLDSMHEILRPGWGKPNHFKFDLQEVLSPSICTLHPAGALERAPPRLKKFTSWLNEQHV